MEAEYKKELGKSYLILEPPSREDDFSAQMMLENRIQGLLSFERRSFNGETKYYYDITGKRSLESHADKELLGEKDIRRLLQGLYCVIGELYSYFLETEGLLLRATYIYEEEEQMCFCYYPSDGTDSEEIAMVIFAEELLELIDHDDDEAVELTYRFYKSVKESGKGILHILEEVLVQEVENPQKELYDDQQEMLLCWHNICEDESEKKAWLIKRSRPDICTEFFFLLSLLVSICYLSARRFSVILCTGTGAIGCLFVLASVVGMAAGFVDIDIARKK